MTAKKSAPTSKRSSGSRAATNPEDAYPFDWPTASSSPRAVTDEELDSDAPLYGQAYEDRYVGFIDILGFKELIRKSAAKEHPKHAEVASIYSALNISVLEGGAATGDLRLHTFSDFVVVSAPATEAGLVLVMFRVWAICRDWLSRRFLSRGGITRGEVLHHPQHGSSPAMVFGPAFVEAYTLESQLADFPRVLLSKDVRQDWERMWTKPYYLSDTYRKLVRDCDDGPRCVDIFADIPIGGFNLFGSDNSAEWRAFRQALLDHLEDAADTPAWYKKTQWLVLRFNAAVDESAADWLRIPLGGG